MKRQKYRKCSNPHCGFAKNRMDATVCQKCNSTLVRDEAKTSQRLSHSSLKKLRRSRSRSNKTKEPALTTSELKKRIFPLEGEETGQSQQRNPFFDFTSRRGRLGAFKHLHLWGGASSSSSYLGTKLFVGLILGVVAFIVLLSRNSLQTKKDVIREESLLRKTVEKMLRSPLEESSTLPVDSVEPIFERGKGEKVDQELSLDPLEGGSSTAEPPKSLNNLESRTDKAGKGDFKNSPPAELQFYSTISDVIKVPQGNFNYGGSICFAAFDREGFNEAIKQVYPQFQLNYVEPRRNPGCNAEIERLLSRKLSFAHNARPLKREEHQLARQQGVSLESIPIAIDGIVAYTHQSSGIESLSVAQLQKIYRGKITNWQEVGGSDLPITIFSLDPLSNNDLEILWESTKVDKNNRERADWQIVRDYTTAIRQVSSTPGAISLASTAILQEQQSIKPLALAKERASLPVSAILANGKTNLQAIKHKTYPLTRRLFVVVRRDGTVAEKAGVAYANLINSKEGQAFVRKAGALGYRETVNQEILLP